MMKYIAVAAIVVATTLVHAQSPGEDLKKQCPLYAARSEQCSGSCAEVGNHCTASCSTLGSYNNREICSNATHCALRNQASGSMSASCAPKCSDLKGFENCFSFGCAMYEGACQQLPSSIGDAEACNNSVKIAMDAGATSIKQYYDPEFPLSNKCVPKCNLAPSKYTCEYFSTYCAWNWNAGTCGPKCSSYGASFERCLTVYASGCRWEDGACAMPCDSNKNANSCISNGCTWFKGKCQKRCNQIVIPGNGANYSSRLVCLNNPLCGGEFSCSAMNCSLIDTNKRECEAESNCRWVGSSSTDGYCTLPCGSQWDIKRECNVRGPNNKGPVVCARGIAVGGELNDCTDADCGNYTTAFQCLYSFGSCTWDPSTSMCIDDAKSCGSLQVETQDASRACNGSSYCRVRTTGSDNSKRCVAKCDSFKSEFGCWGATGCQWQNNQCLTSCGDGSTYNQTECESDSLRGHCRWYNDSLAMRGQPGCYSRCETFSDEACHSIDGCALYGGKSDYKTSDCGCRRQCESNSVDECPSPCYRSDKLGGYCVSPKNYGRFAVCEEGLSAGAVAGAVIGAIVGTILIIVIIACVCKYSGSAAASAAGTGSAEPADANKV